MAIGDESVAAGYGFVPDTGSQDALVKWGAREINRTRDFVAQIMNLIPTGKAGYRAAAGLTIGTAVPANNVGDDGDWFARYI